MSNSAYVHMHTLCLPLTNMDIAIASAVVVPLNQKETKDAFWVTFDIKEQKELYMWDSKTIEWYKEHHLESLLEGVTSDKGGWTMIRSYLRRHQIHEVFCSMPQVFITKMANNGITLKPWQVPDPSSYLKGQKRWVNIPVWSKEHPRDAIAYAEYLENTRVKQIGKGPDIYNLERPTPLGDGNTVVITTRAEDSEPRAVQGSKEGKKGGSKDNKTKKKKKGSKGKKKA